MNMLGHLFLCEFKILRRDRMALLLTFLFPLVFILVFGFLMRDIGDVSRATMGYFASSDLDWEALDAVVDEAGTLAIVPFADRAEIEEAVTSREVDFGLVWDGTELSFLYDATRVQENYTFQQVASGIIADYNLRRQGVEAPIGIEMIDVGSSSSTSWFSLVLPGILAFSVLSAGLTAISGHVTAMKERKILDRLVVTPMRPVLLLVAVASLRLSIAYISTLITLLVGVLLFDLRYDIDWLRYTVCVISGTLGSMGLGTVIALLVRRPSSASNIAHVASMLMLFLAGVYFPIEFMPGFLRALSVAMPLTHMANTLRYAMGVVDMSEIEFWAVAASLVAIACILFPILARYVVRPLRR